MYEIEAKISDAELEIMGVLWEAKQPLNLAAIRQAISERSSWSGDTVKTLLRRLCAKGAVGQEKREVYYYHPLVTAEAYGAYGTRLLADKLYRGSVGRMVAAMVKSEQLAPEDVAELRALLQGGGGGDRE